jgi:mono/diheme cytochrome c family protein
MKSALLLSVLLLGIAGPGVPGPARATETDIAAPPFDLADPARVEAGRKRFGSTCAAYCHGNEGSGGKTPPFRGNTAFSTKDAFKTITEGRRASDVMPPWGNAFSAEQIWELVAYLDHLSKLPAAP